MRKESCRPPRSEWREKNTPPPPLPISVCLCAIIIKYVTLPEEVMARVTQNCGRSTGSIVVKEMYASTLGSGI